MHALRDSGTVGTIGIALALGAATFSIHAPAATGAVPDQSRGTASTAGLVAPAIDQRPIPALTSTARADSYGREVVAQLRDPSTSTFRMIGVTWRAGTTPQGVLVEARFLHAGSWSGWQQLDVDPEEGPTPAEETDARDGTAPLWVGNADGIDVRVLSDDGSAATDPQLTMIDPGSSSAATTSAAATDGRPLQRHPRRPQIITRQQWGADPSLRGECWDPPWGTTIQAVFVHHTAGSNGYTSSDSAAIVRGIYAYHVQARGWCDIGYNFLVDRYGQIFEGRDGGTRLPIRGAHSGEYNVNTAGISLMGTFEVNSPPRKMKGALVRLVSWVLGSHYRNPLGRTTLYSSTTAQPTGFNVISGHRDSMNTSCPGEVVYRWLPTLRQRVANYIGSDRSRIYRKWQRLGGESGWVGSPFVGERSVAGGRRTVFTSATIYRLPGLRAHEVHGALLNAYRGVGGVHSALGWPTTDTRTIQTGHRSYFQHGYITRDTATGRTTVTYR